MYVFSPLTIDLKALTHAMEQSGRFSTPLLQLHDQSEFKKPFAHVIPGNREPTSLKSCGFCG